MVLISLHKAFDTVDHVILFKKLEAMGCPLWTGLGLIEKNVFFLLGL